MGEINPNLRTIRDGMIDHFLIKREARAIVENDELFDDWVESITGLPDDPFIDAEFVAVQLGVPQVLAQAVLNAGWGDALE